MTTQPRQRLHPQRKLTFRGTTLGPNALTQIRRALTAPELVTRHAICRRICQTFGWRARTGELALSACRNLLVRLEREGLIRLPPSRVVRPRAARRPAALSATGFALDDVGAHGMTVRPVRTAERGHFRALLDRHHYLGGGSLPGASIFQVAFCDGVAVGLLAWGPAALRNPPRDAWLGWNEATRIRRLHLVANNVRFLMLPDAAGRAPHLASRILGAGLARLSRDFAAQYAHPVLLAETFIDAARFAGTCYRASNWFRLGVTSGWARRGPEYVRHGRPKDVFVYPLHRRAREWLAGPECPLDHPPEPAMHLDVSQLPLEGAGGLFAVLEEIVDPRMRRGVRHKVGALLALGVTAKLAGARSFVAIAQWVENLSGELRARLGGSRWKSPSESTFRRVFAQLDAEELERKIGAWSAQRQSLSGAGLALDGKTLRGSRHKDVPGVHLVSAVLHRDGTVLAQAPVPDKSNEIKSVRPVLGALDLTGAVVTGDAMFTQQDIVQYVVEEKHADFVLTVKDNQPKLHADIQALGMESFSPSVPPKKSRSRPLRGTAHLGG